MGDGVPVAIASAPAASNLTAADGRRSAGDTGQRTEQGYVNPGEAHPRPGCPGGSACHAVYYTKDDGIGISPRHHEQAFKMFKRLHGRDEYGGGTGAGPTRR